MKNVPLIMTLIRRGIEQRYRGSVLGLLWAFLTPLIMLLVFTFVFGVVFQSRWAGQTDNIYEFAIVLFAGITTFTLFSEIVGNAPSLITSQPNLVKKVVFPLEILPIITLGEALFQAAIAYCLLIIMNALFGQGFSPAFLALPFLLLPLLLTALGMSWFLAATGVFVRDISQFIQPVLTALMFLSAVFFPLSAMPDWIQPVMAFNPLAVAVEMVRNALVFGILPNIQMLASSVVAGAIIAVLGYLFFQKTKRGFADVL